MTTGNLAIQDNETVVQYGLTGSYSFSTNFPILANDELKVSIDQEPLTYGTHYTITGLGQPGGVTVTLTAAGEVLADAGEFITLWQDMPIRRLTGFSAGASTLLPESLNAELARSVRVEQQLRREIRNCVRLATDDPVGGQDMVLPIKELRVGRYMAFDADGLPIPASGTGADSALREDLANGEVSTDGARLVAFRHTEAAAVERSVHVLLGERVSASMFSTLSAAVAAAQGRTLLIPAGTYTDVSDLTIFDAAGTRIMGESQYTTILRPPSGFTGSMVKFSSALTHTSAFNLITGVRFDLNGEDCTGIDLSSCNNTFVREVFFAGGPDFANAIGRGVLFSSPQDRGSYNNVVEKFRMDFLAVGIEWDTQANKNGARDGDILGCILGASLAPTGGVGNPWLDNVRFEGGGRGILEGAQHGVYKNLWMEGNSICDIEFTPDSAESLWLGGQTATTVTPLVGLSSVPSIYALSPDLVGVILRSGSTSRPHNFTGRNIFGVDGDTATSGYPTGVSSAAAYFRGGRAYLDNAIDLCARNAAGNGTVFLVRADTSDRVYLGAGGEEVRFGAALVSMGGGSTPTLGTIGGDGPGVATQNSWKRFYDSTGAAFYVPVWK